MAVAPKPLTLEQFLELPQEELSLEFMDGVVTQKVSPKGQHNGLQAELVERLNQAARSSRLARAFPELRATFGGASYVPDVSVYRWDRIPREVSGRIANDFLIPPDITIEIVSPEQSTNALVRRCLWYVAHGIAAALLVDPLDESVLAFRADQEVGDWHARDQIDLTEILPDFELTVEQLFASLL